MSRFTLRFTPPKFMQNWHLIKDIGAFVAFLQFYLRHRGYAWFARFEVLKDFIVDILYKKRGKYARPFLHFGTIGLVFVVITLGPLIFAQAEEEQITGGGPGSGRGVLSAAAAYGNFSTIQATEVQQYRGGEIIIHRVAEGETISTIADKYGLQTTTILWENDLDEDDAIKPGQELRILPVDGVRHKVARGETIYSVGKKYDLDESQVQTIVDYPFNTFLNDETFELATGQFLMVPGGVEPNAVVLPPTPRPTIQPPPGSLAGSGQFVWPASGRITQGYSGYHRAIDVANRAGGAILAADSGTVVGAGWLDNSGYGNRVIIDHGNGYVTLYAHLSVVQVSPGQQVSRGSVVGQMGSTGRSTGVHLHFEIRQGGVLLNPLSYL